MSKKVFRQTECGKKCEQLAFLEAEQDMRSLQNIERQLDGYESRKNYNPIPMIVGSCLMEKA